MISLRIQESRRKRMRMMRTPRLRRVKQTSDWLRLIMIGNRESGQSREVGLQIMRLRILNQ